MTRIAPFLLLLVGACSGAESPAPVPAPAAPTSQPAAAATSQPAATLTSQPAPAAANAATEPVREAGGLRWDVSETFAPRTPKSRMRAAEYGVRGGAADAELTVYYFGPGQGGTVQANLDRWIGQFSQPDGKDSKHAATIAEQKAGDLEVTTLDLTGTFDGGMAPMAQGGAPTPKTDYRVLGAIAKGPNGPVFFKLVGPANTLETAQAAFDALVSSLVVVP